MQSEEGIEGIEQPTIRMELVDGTNTWITVCPVNVESWVEGQENFAAERAAGECFTMFLTNLIRESEAVTDHLARFKRG